MSQPSQPVERYETELFSGGRTELSLRGLPPGEPQRLGPIFAAIDPWARLGYKADALSAYLGTLEKSAPRYAIMIGNEVAGVAGIRLNWLRGPYVQFLGILPQYQKHKLGTAFLAWLVHEARRHGEQNVWVLASTFNADALRFYEANGFERTGELADLVSPGTAEYLLRRKLT
jgi:ribosomal protein S18 acetylase RimI-like enzyme